MNSENGRKRIAIAFLLITLDSEHAYTVRVVSDHWFGNKLARMPFYKFSWSGFLVGSCCFESLLREAVVCAAHCHSASVSLLVARGTVRCVPFTVVSMGDGQDKSSTD